jgi:prevent-host-death family protein
MPRTLALSVADTKKRFSELLGRVAYGDTTVVVTKRGRPIARLVGPESQVESLQGVRGWLDDDDPFFAAVDRIVKGRSKHTVRRTTR